MPIRHNFVPQSVQKVAASSSCEPQLWQNRSGTAAVGALTGVGGATTGAGGGGAAIGALSGASGRVGLFKAPARRRTKSVWAGIRSQAGNWLANGESCWLPRDDGKLVGNDVEPPGAF